MYTRRAKGFSAGNLCVVFHSAHLPQQKTAIVSPHVVRRTAARKHHRPTEGQNNQIIGPFATLHSSLAHHALCLPAGEIVKEKNFRAFQQGASSTTLKISIFTVPYVCA